MKIEIWSDIACPFCYIGGRHLELALEQLDFRDEVQTEWRSFQLDPTAAVENQENVIAMLARKYGMTMEQAAANQRQVAAKAAEVGLEMSEEGGVQTNTLDAHRLLHLAARHDLADELGKRLWHAHFAERRNVGRHDVLRELAIEVGLPADEVEALLSGDGFAAEVAADQAEAARIGVRGVPFFVIDRKYALNGAQPVEAFTQALQQAWDERGTAG